MRLFNFWRPYPLLKPREAGWYQCSILDRNDSSIAYVMDLYFNPVTNEWIDTRRERVFRGYKVYKSGREPMELNRVYMDILCFHTDEVYAWKKMQRACWFGRKRG